MKKFLTLLEKYYNIGACSSCNIILFFIKVQLFQNLLK